MMELVTPSTVFTEKPSKEQLAVPWTEVEALIAMAQAAIQAKTAAGERLLLEAQKARSDCMDSVGTAGRSPEDTEFNHQFVNEQMKRLQDRNIALLKEVNALKTELESAHKELDLQAKEMDKLRQQVDAQRAGVPPAVADHELAEQHFDEPRLEGPSTVEEGKELQASPTSAKENVRPVDWTSPSPDQKQGMTSSRQDLTPPLSPVRAVNGLLSSPGKETQEPG